MRLSAAYRSFPFVNQRRWLVLFLVVLAIQATATYLALMHTFGVVVRVSAGGTASFTDKLVTFTHSVLSFPIFTLLDHLRATADWLYGVWERLPFVLNGAVWAGVASLLVRSARSNIMPGELR